ncbi:MAG: VIT domain-containing protein, partial [Acidobacteriota bacterium]
MKTDLEQREFTVIDSRSGQPVDLALQELFVSGTILPVGAVLNVRHVFRSGEQAPLEVIYAFGLPRDAALRRFRIVAEGYSVDSELRPTAEAEQLYEAGIDAGNLSSLARQYRDGVINLNVGNIRPGETVTIYLEIIAGVELRDDGLRFRFPFTLAPTYHAAARSVEAARGAGEMELPEDFDNVVLPLWMKDPQGLHRIGFDLQVVIPAGLATLDEIGSPSHAIRVRYDKDQHRVSLAPETEVPDRDLVLDIRTRAGGPAITGGVHQGRGNFAVIVPSAIFGTVERPQRRFVFV